MAKAFQCQANKICHILNKTCNTTILPKSINQSINQSNLQSVTVNFQYHSVFPLASKYSSSQDQVSAHTDRHILRCGSISQSMTLFSCTRIILFAIRIRTYARTSVRTLVHIDILLGVTKSNLSHLSLGTLGKVFGKSKSFSF